MAANARQEKIGFVDSIADSEHRQGGLTSKIANLRITMRNFLTTTKSGLSAIAAVGRRTCLAAMLATSLSATSAEFAHAQSPHAMAPSTLSLADGGEQSYGLVSGASMADGTEGMVTGSGRGAERRVPANVVSMPSVVNDPGSYYGGEMVSGGAPCFTPGCDVSWYIGYEALWLRPEGDDNFSLTQFARMPEFDYELGEFGGRITAGRLFDCTNGFEVVYTGPYEWTRGVNVLGNGNLDSRFSPNDGYTGASINAFNDADQHVQTYRANSTATN